MRQILFIIRKFDNLNLIYKRLAKTNEILAVTFTNKAALEMKQRVEKILNIPVEGMFIGTFHSIGVRFLRKHSNLVNLKEFRWSVDFLLPIQFFVDAVRAPS